jgi:hypothetical protein
LLPIHPVIHLTANPSNENRTNICAPADVPSVKCWWLNLLLKEDRQICKPSNFNAEGEALICFRWLKNSIHSYHFSHIFFSWLKCPKMHLTPLGPEFEAIIAATTLFLLGGALRFLKIGRNAF